MKKTAAVCLAILLVTAMTLPILSSCSPGKTDGGDIVKTQSGDVTVRYEIFEDERYDDTGKIQLFTGHLILPLVEIEENKEAERAISDYFDGEKKKYSANVESLVSDSKSLLEDVSSDYWDTFFYYAEYSTKMIDDKFISFMYNETFYGGGAHSTSEIKGVVISLESGKVMTLSDIVNDKAAFTDYISEKIKSAVENDEDFEFVSADYADVIPTLVADGNFFFGVDKLTFICNTYVIFPYSSGTKYYDFSYKSIADFLKVSISADREFIKFYDFNLDGENDESVIGYISPAALAGAYDVTASYSVRSGEKTSVCVVPRYIGSTVFIEKIIYSETGDADRYETVAEFAETTRDFCLRFYAPVPSDKAGYRIRIKYGESEAVRDVSSDMFIGETVTRVTCK